MAIDREQLRALVDQPTEALQIELKTWIDPRADEGIAKLVKAIFAIRNRNGGFLLLGFDDVTREPSPYPFEEDVGSLFHLDKLQALVSRYVNPSFEIRVDLVDRDDQLHPVISIPEGVRVPAIVRRDLMVHGGKKLLSEGDLYFRTFNSNGTASSARILPGDFEDLLDVCFENREADIGRFLRRHLAGVGSGETFASMLGAESDESRLRKRALGILEGGSIAATNAIELRASSDERARIADTLTMHVGLALEPARVDALPTDEFLNRVTSSNPNLTGWPVWLDSRGFREELDRPYVKDGVWEALIISLDGGWSEHVDFLRLSPQGEFYLQRVMQDDLTDKVPPRTALDVILMIYRVAEVLAVGTTIARSLGWETETKAGFAFRWTGLNGRALRPWVNAFRSFGRSGSRSRTSTADSYVAVPLETPSAALAPYVSTAVAPLFSVFDGYAPPAELIETYVRKLIERRMDD